MNDVTGLGSNIEDVIGLGIFGFLLAIILIAVVVGVVFYVLNSIALSRMAKKLNIENPWMAWVPIANTILLGKIAGDKVTVFGKRITNLGVVLVLASLATGFLALVPFVGFLVSIAYLILYYSTLNKIYRIFNEESATLYTVLSIVLLGLLPILLLIVSKREPNLIIFNEDGANTGAPTGYGNYNQGYNNQGYNNQGYNNQGYNNQGYNNQGYNNQGYNNQGYGGYTQPSQPENAQPEKVQDEDNDILF